MTLFLRWIISKQRGAKEIETFLAKAKQIPYSDREEIIKDYKFFTSIAPGDVIVDSLDYYAGLSGFIGRLPSKPAKLEDFITEFDMLANHWKLETGINQEDGRPFAYEVDHKFFDNLIEQSLDMTLLPYDYAASSENNADISSETHTLGGFAGNSGLDGLITSLAAITGSSSKSIPKGRFPKLRYADWGEFSTLVPDLDLSQIAYRAMLNRLKDVDMELRLEHDLLLSADHEYVGSRLKENAKKIWHLAAAVPNCRPVNTKITLIPQSHDYKPSQESADPRHAKVFDFGIKIPDSSPEVHNNRVLDYKKQAYGLILKANADSKKLEQEIKNADPNREFDASNYIVPTVASVFAEHEVLAWLQLRHIQIRNARIKIVRQYNFFRSTQKRLALDVDQLTRCKSSIPRPTSVFIQT
jgi:hypothetical protein